MNKHKHADLIHAWAEGAEIQCLHPHVIDWKDDPFPHWGDKSEYRIKPKEPNWWENIPEHGVLCWVCDVNESPNSEHSMAIIISSALETNQGAYWHYATPLTNEEIKQFLRGE